MNQEMYQRIVSFLTETLSANHPKCIKLNMVPDYLSRISVDRSEYNSIGLKRWISEQFSNYFIIMGSQGFETLWPASDPEAQALAKIEPAIQARLAAGNPILLSDLPAYLNGICGKDCRIFAPDMTITQWLTSRLGQYEKGGEEDRYLIIKTSNSTDSTSHPVVTPAETQQMHAFAFMNMWSSNGKLLRQYPALADMADNSLRDIIAQQIARALLDPSRGAILALEETPPRIAFPTGLKTQNGILYSVLSLNPKNVDGKIQFWALQAFCCPGDQREDGLGLWLKNHLTVQTSTRRLADPAKLNQLISQIRQSGSLLQPQLQEYQADLEQQREPDPALAEGLASYQALWKQLRAQLKGSLFLSAAADERLTLSDLESWLQEEAGACALADQAVALFAQIVNGIDQFYIQHKIADPQKSTPQKDLAWVKASCFASAPVENYQQFRALTVFYADLLAVMKAQWCTDVTQQAVSVSSHFTELASPMIPFVVGAAPEEYACLLALDQLNQVLQACITSTRDAQPAQPAAEDLTPAKLLSQTLLSKPEQAMLWVSQIGALLPQDERKKALVLNDSETLARLLTEPELQALQDAPQELTPFGAGSRLYAICADKDDLAEKYFLLGTLYQAAQCVPVLLRLYRQQNRLDAFQTILDGFRDKVAIPDPDELYALVLQCSDQAHLDQLETYLEAHPALLKNREAMQVVDLLQPLRSCRPAAFWAWIGQSLGDLNELEAAIASNHLDTIRDCLNDAARMAELGYTTEETTQIRQALVREYPIGSDSYSQAMRLLLTQGNKNGTAERMLWTTCTNPKAVDELFHLYCGQKDPSSICWIVQHLKLQLEERSAQTQAYLESLVQTQNRDTLVKFVAKHPFLWYSDGVLSMLASIGSSLESDSIPWLELQQWHSKHPFQPATAFEQALQQGDLSAVHSCLSDTAQMEAWGYDAALRGQIEKAMENTALAWDQDQRSVFERINAFQGNFHRFLEKYLYDCKDCPQDQLYQQLFDLLYAENRNLEAAAYFEAYPVLRASERNCSKYLWSLLHLGRFQRALQQASDHPEWLQHDARLSEAVCTVARKEDPKLADRLTRILSLLPSDLFEKYVISGDLFNLSRLVSNPSQLTELGYSREKIAYFKECLGKPYPKASDGFAVGARVRIFLGDERAEPFLLNAENDPRATHALFDIYTNQKRWDDLCMLYQRHQEQDVWSDHHKKLYYLALTRAVRPENNRLCIDFILREFINHDPPRNNSDVQWLYLRALLGKGDSVPQALGQTMIPSGSVRFIQPRIGQIFDLLWDKRYRDRQEDAIRLAEELMHIYQFSLTLDEKEFVASINGLLPNDPNRSAWAKFLQENGCQDILRFLNCRMNFGLEQDPEKEAQFCRDLCRQLDLALPQPVLMQRLVLYSMYVEHSLAPAPEREALSDRLLTAWSELLSSDSKELSLDAWSAFSKVSGGMLVTASQYHQVLQMWHSWAERAADPEAKQKLAVCGTRILLAFSPDSAADPAVRQLADQLAACWIELLSLDEALNQESQSAFVALWTSPFLTQAQSSQMDQALAGWLQRIEQPDSELLEQWYAVLSPAGAVGQNSLSFRQLIDAFIRWLDSRTDAQRMEHKDLIASLIDSQSLTRDQMSQIMEILKAPVLFEDEDLRGAVQQRCSLQWPVLAYSWKKHEYLYFRGADQQESLLHQLLEIADQQMDDLVLDETDLDLLHKAVTSDLTLQNLQILLRACQKVETPDPSKIEILQTFIASDFQEGDPARLGAWLYAALEQRDIEWFKNYSIWWAGLVHLSSQDQTTKTMVDFLGLAQNRVQTEYQQSVIRLLLSDLSNNRYLKCFLRICDNLSPLALSKLEYIEAVQQPDRIEETIKRLIDRQQYGLAIDLLIYRLTMPVTDSSTIGPLIGALYTPAALEQAPVLKDKLPELFDGIERMNRSDSIGIWKNLGRAVDAACLADSEDILFEHLGKSLFLNAPGKAAAVIAHMMLRGAFSQAQFWITQERTTANKYLELLQALLAAPRTSETLSPREELLVRSIPRDGNVRPVEFYGELIHFAFSRAWKKECAIVFSELYQADTHDVALMSCLIQLYAAAPDEISLDLLYNVSLQYLTLSKFEYTARPARSLMVIVACMPSNPLREDHIFGLIRAQISSKEQSNGVQLDHFRALKDSCRRFLDACGQMEDLAACRQKLLIQAATGWWRIDHAMLDQLYALSKDHDPLLPVLASIYPRSFVAACFRMALTYQSDLACREKLQALLRSCDEDADQRRGFKGAALCASQLDCVAAVEPIRVTAMEKLLDCPMEIPAQYRFLLDSILDNPNENQVKAELNVLFALRPGFTYEQYRNGTDGLRESVKSKYPQYDKLVTEQLVCASGSLSERPNPPATYLDIHNYMMVYQAANFYLQQSNRPVYVRLNESYLKLGQLMTDQLSEEEKDQISLSQFLNMTNLLCQSNAYEDIKVLMALCPAKWKICIRCLQELIQGKPSHVLPILQRREFQAHKGCWNLLFYIVYTFVSYAPNGRPTGQALVIEENRLHRRLLTEGTIALPQLLDLYRTVSNNGDVNNIRHPFLFQIRNRNPKDIGVFRQDIKDLMDELRQEDAYQSQDDTDTDDEFKSSRPNEITAAYRSFKTTPYVQEQVEPWLSSLEEDPALLETRRKEWSTQLENADAGQRIELCSKLLALDWQTDGNTTDAWYCAELGLALYDKACEKKGMAVYATPKARRILYEMAACLPGFVTVGGISEHIQTALSQCLASYTDLSELTSDCSEPYMDNLYRAVSDSKKQNILKNYIAFVRSIGDKMSAPMTNTERLNWLRQCISWCQSERSNLNTEPMDTLIHLLNQQILSLQYLAQLTVVVYNQTGPLEEGYLFGKIENFGAQPVSNIQMELQIDGVSVRQYRLKFLDGKAMAPFDLPYSTALDKESFAYSIVVRFFTDNGSGAELQTVQYDGHLQLIEPEYTDFYPQYQADVPADATNYVERSSLEAILNSLYGNKHAFRDFPNLAIYGMRRTGKSSMLRYMERMLASRAEEDLVYYAECSAESANGTLYERVHLVMVVQTLRDFNKRYPDLCSMEGWAAFCEFWKNLPPENELYSWDWLDQFFSDLDAKFLHGKGLVIFVDEVEKICSLNLSTASSRAPGKALEEDILDLDLDTPTNAGPAEDTDFWNTLSRITQRSDSPVRFVLCGSDLFANKVLEGDNLTQFFQRIKKLSIGRMTRTELDQTIRSLEKAKNSTLKFEPDTLEYMWRIVGGLPWHAKIIINSIIEKRLIMEEDCTRHVLYPSDILERMDAVLSGEKESSDNNFGLVGLSPDEEVLLSAVTEHLTHASSIISEQDLKQIFHAAVPEENWEKRFAKACKTLLKERQLLERDQMGRYRFGCELYRLYNRREYLEQFVESEGNV